MAFPSVGGHHVCGAHHSFAVGLFATDRSGGSLIADPAWFSLWAASVSIREFRDGFYFAHRSEKRKREVDGGIYFAKSQKIGKREIDKGLYFAFLPMALRSKADWREGRLSLSLVPLAPFMRDTSFLGRCPFSRHSVSRQATAEASRLCLCRIRSSRQFARSPPSLLP